MVELERTARSAAEAADALGVRVQQIVKSLVFRDRETERSALVLAGGANRVDESKISDLFSDPVEMADAATFVRGPASPSVACHRSPTPSSPPLSLTRIS